jgi:hypothetical protein
MGRFLLLLVALVFVTGCATQARTPWGNLDMKGGSGSECKPWVAPDAGSRQLPALTPRVVRPVAPVAPVVLPVPAAPVPASAEVTGICWPPTERKDLACVE